jgi:hypothetical protein
MNRTLSPLTPVTVASSSSVIARLELASMNSSALRICEGAAQSRSPAPFAKPFGEFERRIAAALLERAEQAESAETGNDGEFI